MTHASKQVAFLHPDLGLGGAERLVVDAAAGLAELGHQVFVFTAFHDPTRSFRETVRGPFTVTVSGSWFPRNILGRGHAFCAYVRCILVAFCIAWTAFRCKRQYDVVIVDQVSAVIPFLHWLTTSKVLFYCHHPDLLLARRRHAAHQLYRMPLDWLEEHTTGQADLILANSQYTAEVFGKTFRQLQKRGLQPGILHPACHVPSQEDLEAASKSWKQILPLELVAFLTSGPVFLSINRFERKKDVGLAIQALARLAQNSSSTKASRSRLVIAGGYDKRLAENREYLEELRSLASDLRIQEKVHFMPSFTDEQRSALLAACDALLYTPVNEHFGIVPLEAMAACRPVVACNSGGPRESIVNAKTGFLCEPTPQSFAAAMQLILDQENASLQLGENARAHVLAKFSRPAFGAKLQAILEELIEPKH